MSYFPGCDCGHPWAEPAWIDHHDGCPFLAPICDVCDSPYHVTAEHR